MRTLHQLVPPILGSIATRITAWSPVAPCSSPITIVGSTTPTSTVMWLLPVVTGPKATSWVPAVEKNKKKGKEVIECKLLLLPKMFGLLHHSSCYSFKWISNQNDFNLVYRVVWLVQMNFSLFQVHHQRFKKKKGPTDQTKSNHSHNKKTTLMGHLAEHLKTLLRSVNTYGKASYSK